MRKRLREAGLAVKVKRRGTPQRAGSGDPGSAVLQDGSTQESVPGAAWDLILTMDDAISEVYSGFFVVELARGARDAGDAGPGRQPVHGPGVALLAPAGGGREGDKCSATIKVRASHPD